MTGATETPTPPLAAVPPPAVSKGLAGVVVAETTICRIDGEKGFLSYRGYPIDELAGKVSFEETVHLLWEGELPTRAQLADFRVRFASSWGIPPTALKVLETIAPKAEAMEALRTAVSALSIEDPDSSSNDAEANKRKAFRLTVQIPQVVAAYERLRKGQKPVAPDPKASIAENFLYQMRGTRPDPIETNAFDVGLVLHADHDLNASTFAGRVTVATLSDLHSGIVSAIGALKGPLHGGANTEVMKMLEKIGGADPAVWIRAALARKEKVMGFGHRVYKVKDPRAYHLERLSEELCEKTNSGRLFEMSRAIEETVKEEKGLVPNVDFYSATAYHAMGIPKDLFTPIFAVSRIAGWCAHAFEQYADNRLIRPNSHYKGPEGKTFTPIEDRG